MSYHQHDFEGPLSLVAVPIGETIGFYSRSTPQQRNLALAGHAAALLGWLGYLLPYAFSDEWAGPVLRAPLSAPADAWMAFGVWVGLALLAALWLLTVHRTIQRDYGAALWSLLLAGCCAALLWFHAYPDWGPVVVFLLKGFYIGWLAAHVTRFLLTAQWSGGNAEREINRWIRRRNAELRPAGSRRRFFF